jgi:cytochrome c-type biogenesis protein CcmH/NrfG
MEGNRDEVMEARLKKAARRAWRKLLKSMKSEPTTLVIESDNARADSSEETATDIRAFLFKRR